MVTLHEIDVINSRTQARPQAPRACAVRDVWAGAFRSTCVHFATEHSARLAIIRHLPAASKAACLQASAA